MNHLHIKEFLEKIKNKKQQPQQIQIELPLVEEEERRTEYDSYKETTNIDFEINL